MNGRVFRRSKSGPWIIRYDLPAGQNEKRQQKQESCPGLTKKQAEHKLRDTITAINNGTFVLPSKMTVGGYLNKWLEDYATNSVGPKTFERYAQFIHQHIIPALGDKYLDKLRPIDIQEYYSEALKTGRLDGKGGLSALTVLHIHRLLHKALVQAVKWQMLVRNPVDAAEPPRIERKEMKVISGDQITQLIATTEGTMFFIPVLLAVTTGMRRGEIMGLKWDDIDLNTGCLTLRRAVIQIGEKLMFKAPKTQGSRRTIVLPKAAIAGLKAHKEQQDAEKRLFGEGYQKNDLVCAMPDGQPIPPDDISNKFRWIVKRAGLPYMRFHDLRHTSATILIASGVPVKVVSERLGHCNTSITQDIYTHVLPNMQQQAADVMDALLEWKEEKAEGD
jgi:integrase